MISLAHSRYLRKPNFRARASIHMRAGALSCGIQVFNYLSYFLFYYISEGYEPLLPKAERESRTVSCARGERTAGAEP